MSTAIVSAEHINVILEAATREADEGFEWFAQGKWWTFTRSNRDRIGQLMLDPSPHLRADRNPQSDRRLRVPMRRRR